MQSLINSRYLLWIILALPALPFVNEFISPIGYYPEMMQRTGLLSVQLLVFTLSITPITMLLKPYLFGRAIARWLLTRRKYFGLASALYAVLHTVLYLREINWDLHLALLEGLDWQFATGWIALALYFVVALVSNQSGIRLLGRSWKPVQRLTYPIAILVFAHWLILDPFLSDPLVWIMLLAIMKLVHAGLRINQSFAISPSSRKELGN